MKYKVLLKEEAKTDLGSAFQWYETKQEGLGLRFLTELENSIKILEKEPHIFQIRANSLRYCHLNRFPYVLVYEIENQDIVIYAVFHTHQNPVRIDVRKDIL